MSEQKTQLETLRRNIAASQAAQQKRVQACPQGGIRIVDLCTEQELREHPLRSLIRMFRKTFPPHGLGALYRSVLKEFGEEAHSKLSKIFLCEHVSESRCGRALEEFSAAIEKKAGCDGSEQFFALLSPGQADLASLIACVVVEASSAPPDLVYTADGKLERTAVDYAARATKSDGSSSTGDHFTCACEAKRKDAARKEDAQTSKLQLEWVDRQISMLDRPGWPRTARQQATLERLRAQRMDLLAVPEPQEASEAETPKLDALEADPDSDQKWLEEMRRFAKISPRGAAEVAFKWRRRARSLGFKCPPRDSIVETARICRDAYKRLLRELDAPSLLSRQLVEKYGEAGFALERLHELIKHADPAMGDIGSAQIGDIVGIFDDVGKRIADAVDRVTGYAGERIERSMDGVLSDAERDLLISCATADGRPVHVRAVQIVERLAALELIAPHDRGQVDSKAISSKIWKTTPKGVRAIETGRYPSG